MPQLIIKGVSAQQTQQLAPKMIEVVSRLVECPEDWVTVELCESKFFDKNGPTEQYPIIQIWWYQRPLPGAEPGRAGAVRAVPERRFSSRPGFLPPVCRK